MPYYKTSLTKLFIDWLNKQDPAWVLIVVLAIVAVGLWGKVFGYEPRPVLRIP